MSVSKIKILIEYKKSKQFGFNPHVWLGVYGDDTYQQYTTSSSGAGYHKESDALARALNQSSLLLDLVNANQQLLLNKQVYGFENGKFRVGGIGNRPIYEVFEVLGMTVEFIEFNFEKTHSKAVFIHTPIAMCGIGE
jgi:hypothetical protein